MQGRQVRWYIVQTYSGDENTVKVDLERRTESMGMTDYIFRVLVPEIVIPATEEGKKDTVERLFPGYVFVEMIVTDESWFVVRNTPGVTGFLGSSGGGTKPIPVLRDEMDSILRKIGAIAKPNFDRYLGKTVVIERGVWEGQEGLVTGIDNDREIAIVSIDMFGQATPTEVSVYDIKER
ncbi:MAG TPA: transcription termination/antitermination protein NusG [Acholeplasmataceae bacterium]|jgi:transcriptional antiterminator NusG|nr:transcription termination/antitermination protein NusG [Acholeplasmataceae bacterium]HQC30804.1 transcription termination/antitermination protein NusG [Acholeplasmataceae bacterium]